MVKLHYTYRGAPITPYRPQGGKGPGKVATVVIVLLLVTGLLYGAWKLYTSMSMEEEQSNTPAYPPLPKLEEEKQTAPAKSTPVSVSTTELPKELVAFDREITQLMNRNKQEEARAKLQDYFRKHNSDHNYYQYAQKKLILCSEALIASGALKTYTPYTVANGDTLGAIAKKHNVTVRALISESNLTNPDRLKIGQQLRIPAKWRGIISLKQKRLFVFQADKLIGVFTLTNLPKDTAKFVFNPKNRTFWKNCGLSDNDWKSLTSMIPENSNTQISCR